VKKLLAGSIRREMELEALNTRQAAEIQQLNRLVCTYLTAGDCCRENTVLNLDLLIGARLVMPTSRWL
jgi:hypothetical protein